MEEFLLLGVTKLLQIIENESTISRLSLSKFSSICWNTLKKWSCLVYSYLIQIVLILIWIFQCIGSSITMRTFVFCWRNHLYYNLQTSSNLPFLQVLLFFIWTQLIRFVWTWKIRNDHTYFHVNFILSLASKSKQSSRHFYDEFMWFYFFFVCCIV